MVINLLSGNSHLFQSLSAVVRLENCYQTLRWYLDKLLCELAHEHVLKHEVNILNKMKASKQGPPRKTAIQDKESRTPTLGKEHTSYPKQNES